MAGSVVLVRPLSLEIRLGFSVIQLLFPECAHAAATAMPNHRGGIEPEGPSRRLKPPAEIDVVACDAELRIKSIDSREARPAERHVAAGDVLGHLIRQKHMNWPTRRCGDGIFND